MPAALNYLGLDPELARTRATSQKAGDLLKSIRPSIQKFHSSEYINALANGDICLAVGYSGDVLQARDRAAEAGNNVNIVYSIPKEGALIWLDAMRIPADAPHPDEAHAFINFMLQPEIAARNSNYVFYANGNLASQQFLDEDVMSDTAIYPDEATLAKLYTTTPDDPRAAAGDHAHLDGSEDGPVACSFGQRRAGSSPRSGRRGPCEAWWRGQT